MARHAIFAVKLSDVLTDSNLLISMQGGHDYARFETERSIQRSPIRNHHDLDQCLARTRPKSTPVAGIY